MLEIGEQNRPDLFDLTIAKPPPLTRDVVEIDERLDADGNVLRRLDAEQTRRRLRELRERGIDSLAICLLHAYVNDTHERQVEQIAREIGFSNISRSSEVAPLIKLVSRAETTTLDAYLNPILAGYVARVWKQFGGPASCHLRLMTSGGNLVAPDSVSWSRQHSVGTCRRCRRTRTRRQVGGITRGDRLGHGWDQHRRQPLRGPSRTSLRVARQRCARDDADDGYRNGRRRRRFDL